MDVRFVPKTHEGEHETDGRRDPVGSLKRAVGGERVSGGICSHHENGRAKLMELDEMKEGETSEMTMSTVEPTS